MWQATVDLQRAPPHEDAAAGAVVLKFFPRRDKRGPDPADTVFEVSGSTGEGVPISDKQRWCIYVAP